MPLKQSGRVMNAVNDIQFGPGTRRRTRAPGARTFGFMQAASYLSPDAGAFGGICATGEEKPRGGAMDGKAADAPAGGPLRDGSITILVVDDDDNVREVVSEMLTDFGYTVVEAASAKAAYAIAHTVGKLDLVVTDVVMPEEDGTRLAARLRHDFPGLRVVFISGYRHAHSLVGEKLLAKTFSAAGLGRFVAESLGQVD